jgi:hypothetical protein
VREYVSSNMVIPCSLNRCLISGRSQKGEKKMKVLTEHAAAQLLAKALKKPVLYISWDYWDGDISDAFKAAPYLKEIYDTEDGQVFADQKAIIICKNEKEQDKLYAMTVGDEGPTKLNKYKGPLHIFALTINKDGELMNENT